MDDPYANGDSQPVGTAVYPADYDNELMIFGRILLNQSVEGCENVQPHHFYFQPHPKVFAWMREQSEKGEWIDEEVAYDPEIRETMSQLLPYCARGAGVPVTSFLPRLLDMAAKREMIALLNATAERTMNGSSASEVVTYLQEELESDMFKGVPDTWQARSASTLIDPPQPREWLTDGLIYRGQISMWFGPPGIKKTLALMDLCAAMATGQNWLIRRYNQPDHSSLVTFHTTRKARVFWIDFDNGEFETEIRVRAALIARNGLEDANFYYISEATPWLELDDDSHIHRVITIALKIDADVIVIDALGMVMGSVDENSPAVATVISKLKALRAATGAAIACVHHPSKSGAQNEDASTYNASGSAKFSNFFEWSIEMRAGEEKDTVIMEVVKHRGWAKNTKFAAEMTYSHFGDEQPELAHELKEFKFYPAAIHSEREQRTTTVRQVVLSILAGGNLNQSELVDAVKAEVDEAGGKAIGVHAIRDTIKTMVDDAVLIMAKGENNATVYSAV